MYSTVFNPQDVITVGYMLETEDKWSCSTSSNVLYHMKSLLGDVIDASHYA